MRRLIFSALAMFLVLILAGGSPQGAHAVPQTFIVNSDAGTQDGVCDVAAGGCTFRDAIFQANSTGDRDTIEFNIPGGGVKNIAVGAPIVITAPVLIHGYTQPGSSCTTHSLAIEIDGSSAGVGNGITINHTGLGTLISGLSIRDWNGHGIAIPTGGLHAVECSNIGLNAAGTAAAPNTGNGVHITTVGLAGGVTIGATRGVSEPDDQERNIISGNGGAGVYSAYDPSGLSGGRLRVSGNYIGTNAAGTAAIANGGSGVVIADGRTSVGRDAAGGGDGVGVGNLISGNTGAGQGGVKILEAADNPQIHGNVIGLNAAGTAAIANQDGIIVEAILTFIGNSDPTWGNVVSGNTGAGILVTPTGDASIKNSYIGTNAAGTAAVPNGTGIVVEGRGGIGDSATTNVISGNTGEGITMRAASGQVVGNIIGYAGNGTTPLPNGGDAIGVYSDGTRSGDTGISIGSTGEGDGNAIYARRPNAGFPLRNGVRIESTPGHQPLRGVYVEGNSINSDGHSIDLRMSTDAANTITPNDNMDADGDLPDSNRPNEFQNSPVVTEAFVSPTATIRGTFHGKPNLFHNLQLYKSTSCDSNTSRQSHTFIGTTVLGTDPNGNATWQSTGLSFVAGDWITVAIRSFDGDGTSEFSNCFQVSSAASPLASSLSPSVMVAGSSQFTLQVTGTNFASNAKIYWNGQELTNTIFFSSTDLRADIPTSTLGQTKTSVNVFVRSDGLDSNTLEFVVSRSSSDVNCDGTANAADALLVLQVLAGITTNNTACSTDANQSGGVSLIDALWVRKTIVGLSEPLQSTNP